MVEDTAANVRPIIPGDIAAAATLLDRGWCKAKEMHEHSGRVSRSATAFISAFRAKFGLGVIWLSEVRVGLSG